MKPLRLALRDSIRIFELAGQSVAIVVGSKTRECLGPRLAKTRAGCYDLGCNCVPECSGGEVNEKYFIVEPIIPSLRSGEVKIRHDGGIDTQRVRKITADSGGQPGGEAILGYSQDFSLEAAFKDALRKMDPTGIKEPGLVEVVSLGALYGGFSGFSRMFVRLQSRQDSDDFETVKLW